MQMPTDLLHLEDADLGGRIEPGAAGRLPRLSPVALDERRALSGSPQAPVGHRLLMVLARRIGAALRDANIALRDGGGDLKAERKKLCYLPGSALGAALQLPAARRELVREAACFVQDLDDAWTARQFGQTALSLARCSTCSTSGAMPARPTFLNAARSGCRAVLTDALRSPPAELGACHREVAPLVRLTASLGQRLPLVVASRPKATARGGLLGDRGVSDRGCEVVAGSGSSRRSRPT